jgi:hypothetical protein
MRKLLSERLDQIPERILSEEFLQARGLGNELGFWIFDYDAAHELEVREYIKFLLDMVSTKQPHLKITHLSLLDSLIDYLRDRGFLEKSYELQKNKGDAALEKALSGPLHMDKLAPYLVDACNAEEQDIILISGIGSTWPMLRAHNFLNSLHGLMGHKPVVLFYPGEYTGQSMSLFGKIASNNYYRAFKLVP